jgi:hypothetical protein
MKKILVYLLAGALLTGTALTAEAVKQIAFGKGKTSATVSGKVQGNGDVDYELRANAGQTMTVDFKASKGLRISMSCRLTVQVKLFLSVQMRAIILKPRYLAVVCIPSVFI